MLSVLENVYFKEFQIWISCLIIRGNVCKTILSHNLLHQRLSESEKLLFRGQGGGQCGTEPHTLTYYRSVTGIYWLNITNIFQASFKDYLSCFPMFGQGSSEGVDCQTMRPSQTQILFLPGALFLGIQQ